MAGVRVGLSDLHVALVDPQGTDDMSYQTPEKIKHFIEATITPNTNSTTLYADDAAVEVAESMGDVEVELGIGDLPTDKYALLLGKTTNADGVVEDSTDDTAPYLALGFKSKKSNGAYRFVWLYKGKFNIPEESYNTKGESVEFNTQTITAKFVARDDKKWRARVDSDDESVDSSVTDAWFTNVYAPTPAP